MRLANAVGVASEVPGSLLVAHQIKKAALGVVLNKQMIKRECFRTPRTRFFSLRIVFFFLFFKFFFFFFLEPKEKA